MDSETPFTALAPPVFNGDNYHVWAVRMEAHLEANDLWEAVEEDYEVLPLPDNPTLAQLRNHKERKARKSKARASLFAAVSPAIFTRIMTMKSAFEIWNFLKNEYEGDERIKGMQVLNLVREFEMQKMKESETIKEYADKLLSIVNKKLLTLATVVEETTKNFLLADTVAKRVIHLSSVGEDLMLTTRPDILHAVSVLSRFLHCASELHLKAAKRVLRYVKGTVDHGILFQQNQDFQFLGFSDSDWAGSYDDMKSTSGYCFTLGSGVFSWSSKKQEIVAQSTAEAEFIAATAAVNQALWLRKLLADLHMEQKESTKVFVDNLAAIAIANNPVFHGKTKHFSIKLFFLRDVQKDGAVCLKYCKTENQLADIFTKALPRSKFEFLIEKLGISTH
ncbi:hypothetical protein GH714_027021 [Hevea brasiliensis]|uniref:Uncharacterized protein n=1 Tax=Hevea brasiliensis TaxID=3981 RepID=A0A6A6NKE1_HEVBR|nr:hypothetical protein GH714_027021 [Hevea brasiliensis]